MPGVGRQSVNQFVRCVVHIRRQQIGASNRHRSARFDRSLESIGGSTAGQYRHVVGAGDGDLNIRRRAIGRLYREGLRNDFTNAQCIGNCRIKVKRPAAIRVNIESTVLAGNVALGNKDFFSRAVGITDRQLSACLLRRIRFRQGIGSRATDNGRIRHRRNGDRNDFRIETAVAVGNLNRERIRAVPVSIRRVAVGTVSIDSNRTVLSRCSTLAGIKRERQFSLRIVDIRSRDRAGNRATVFKAIGSSAAGDLGRIIGAVDRDRNGFNVAAIGRHLEGFLQGIVGAQGLDRRAVGRRVGPLAVRTHCKVAVGPRCAGGLEPAFACIRIDCRQRTARRQDAIFKDVARGRAGNRRRIFSAGDRDHHIRRRAVGGQDRNRIGHGDAFVQGLNIGGSVIQGVIPVAISIDAEGTVVGGDVRHLLERLFIDIIIVVVANAIVIIIIRVNVNDIQFSRCRQGCVFKNITGRIAGNNGAVANRRNGDGNNFGIKSAIAVGNLNRERIGAIPIRIRRVAVGTVSIDRNRAVLGLCRIRAGIQRERQISLRVVHIRCRYSAGGHAIFKTVRCRTAGDHGIIIGAVDRNRHRLGRRAVRRPDLESLLYRIIGAQSLDCRAVRARVGPRAVRLDLEVAMTAGGCSGLENILTRIHIAHKQLAARA